MGNYPSSLGMISMFNFNKISKYLKRVLRDYDPVNNFQSISTYLNGFTSNKEFSLLFDNGITWIILDSGLQIKYLNRFNSVSSIFFDIGANVGLYSMSVANRYKDVEIHAFEPVPDTCHEFKVNLVRNKLDGRIILNPLAVSDICGRVYVTVDHHASNYLVEPTSSQKKLKVDCITIDNYVKMHSIKKIDFIKIDVEGKELSVLKGTERSLEQFRPILLIELIEQNYKFFDRKDDDYKEVIKFMMNLGYKYYVLDDKNHFIYHDKIKEAVLLNSFHNYLFYLDRVDMTDNLGK